jgi:hypothetical protein
LTGWEISSITALLHRISWRIHVIVLQHKISVINKSIKIFEHNIIINFVIIVALELA